MTTAGSMRLALTFLLAFLDIACVRPGGGGMTQVAPDKVSVGESIRVRLELSVWGAGGQIHGRYTDIKLWFRGPTMEAFQAIGPRLVAEDSRRVEYEAIIPGQGVGEVEYYIELRLDGQYSQVPGIKKIGVS